MERSHEKGLSGFAEKAEKQIFSSRCGGEWFGEMRNGERGDDVAVADESMKEERWGSRDPTPFGAVYGMIIKRWECHCRYRAN